MNSKMTNIEKLLKEGKSKISGLRLSIEANDRLIDTASQNLKKFRQTLSNESQMLQEQINILDNKNWVIEQIAKLETPATFKKVIKPEAIKELRDTFDKAFASGDFLAIINILSNASNFSLHDSELVKRMFFGTK